MRILVTGAAGFIGRHLCPHLKYRGHRVRAVVRRDPGPALEADELLIAPDIARHQPDAAAFAGCDAVVHLAARAHVLEEHERDPDAAYWSVNVDATRRWALAAAEAGVKRFVLVSSIGVLGNRTGVEPFTESSPEEPVELYAKTKQAAESAVEQAAAGTGMEFVIVRPPLVYGPDAPGNFGRLLRLASLPVPLPLASLRARRSLVSVWNLVDLLETCVTHPAARGIVLVSDQDDTTLPEILRSLGEGLGRRPLLVPFPPAALGWLANLVGQRGSFEKLAVELRVDSRHASRVLGWKPPYTAREGLLRTGREHAANARAARATRGGST